MSSASVQHYSFIFSLALLQLVMEAQTGWGFIVCGVFSAYSCGSGSRHSRVLVHSWSIPGQILVQNILLIGISSCRENWQKRILLSTITTCFLYCSHCLLASNSLSLFLLTAHSAQILNSRRIVSFFASRGADHQKVLMRAKYSWTCRILARRWNLPIRLPSGPKDSDCMST